MAFHEKCRNHDHIISAGASHTVQVRRCRVRMVQEGCYTDATLATMRSILHLPNLIKRFCTNNACVCSQRGTRYNAHEWELLPVVHTERGLMVSMQASPLYGSGILPIASNAARHKVVQAFTQAR